MQLQQNTRPFAELGAPLLDFFSYLENPGSATALATATAACNSTLKHNLRTLT